MKASLSLGILAATLLSQLAMGAVIFQDTFTGTDGAPFDSTKWTLSGQGTASIQSNQGQLADYGQWQKIRAYSKTGADFLNPTLYQSVVYSGTLDGKGGYYDEGSFGVQGAVTLSYTSGQWSNSLTLNVTVGTTTVGSFLVDTSTTPTFTITLTPTEYTVTASSVISGNASYTGLHSLSEGSYTGGGLWYLYHQSNADTWAGTSTMTLDNLTIEVIPEPASLALLALGGVTLLRRRRS